MHCVMLVNFEGVMKQGTEDLQLFAVTTSTCVFIHLKTYSNSIAVINHFFSKGTHGFPRSPFLAASRLLTRPTLKSKLVENYVLGIEEVTLHLRPPWEKVGRLSVGHRGFSLTNSKRTMVFVCTDR